MANELDDLWWRKYQETEKRLKEQTRVAESACDQLNAAKSEIHGLKHALDRAPEPGELDMNLHTRVHADVTISQLRHTTARYCFTVAAVTALILGVLL